MKEVKEVAAEKKVKEVTAAAVRNNKLLSFGESEDEEDEPSNCKAFDDLIFLAVMELMYRHYLLISQNAQFSRFKEKESP